MRTWIVLAAVGGFLSVAMGAFAAHGLGDRLDPQALQWLETGAQYQMYHALAALGAAALVTSLPQRRRHLMGAAAFFFAGMVLFSGTLYAMGLSQSSAPAMMVPVGGLSYLAGWLCLIWACLGPRPAPGD
jgi:uncharacterized membrane protein YgdD (TMEM256/DUF423 family)